MNVVLKLLATLVLASTPAAVAQCPCQPKTGATLDMRVRVENTDPLQTRDPNFLMFEAHVIEVFKAPNCDFRNGQHILVAALTGDNPCRVRIFENTEYYISVRPPTQRRELAGHDARAVVVKVTHCDEHPKWKNLSTERKSQIIAGKNAPQCSLDCVKCPFGYNDGCQDCVCDHGTMTASCTNYAWCENDPGDPFCKPQPQCSLDTRTCPNGAVIRRDPAHRCEFPDCPATNEGGGCPGSPGCPGFQCRFNDQKVCPDGTRLNRDPLNLCLHPECPPSTSQGGSCPGSPGCPPRVCGLDIKICPGTSGVVLKRDPWNLCKFPACPPPDNQAGGNCTSDTRVCHGVVQTRDPANNCNFPMCTPKVCDTDTLICQNKAFERDPLNDCKLPTNTAGCRCWGDYINCNGAQLVRDIANHCKFPVCDQQAGGVCPTDTRPCNDLPQTRDPANNCNFPVCVCRRDARWCNGAWQWRDPAKYCSFPPCLRVCTTDVLICPGVDRVTLRRDPLKNCAFPACPPAQGTANPPQSCDKAGRSCPGGTVVFRDPQKGCAYPNCPKCCAGMEPNCNGRNAACCPDGTWTCDWFQYDSGGFQRYSCKGVISGIPFGRKCARRQLRGEEE